MTITVFLAAVSSIALATSASHPLKEKNCPFVVDATGNTVGIAPRDPVAGELALLLTYDGRTLMFLGGNQPSLRAAGEVGDTGVYYATTDCSGPAYHWSGDSGLYGVPHTTVAGALQTAYVQKRGAQDELIEIWSLRDGGRDECIAYQGQQWWMRQVEATNIHFASFPLPWRVELASCGK